MKKALYTFKIYYMLYVLVAFTALLNGEVWLDIATYALVAFGSVLILMMMVQYKKYWRARNLYWILGFLASYVLSSVMNIQYGYVDNVKEMFWLAFPMLLLYIASQEYTYEEMVQEGQVLSFIYIVYTTLASVVSIGMFFLGKSYKFQDGMGHHREIGYKWGRLWGVFDDPNHGATIILIGLILAIYYMMKHPKLIVKIGMVIAGVVQYIYIVLSDSRTAEIAMMAAIVIGFGMGTYQIVTKRKSSSQGIALALLVCIGSTVGVYASDKVITEGMGKANAYVQSLRVQETQKPKPKPNTQRAEDIEEDVSNGRFDIWVSALEVANTSPIYGTSFRNIVPYTQDQVPDTYIVNLPNDATYDSMHNSVMDILVSQGIIGLILFFGLVGNTLWYLWKKIYRESVRIEGVALLYLTILAAIASASLFISMAYYLNSPQTYMFWLSFGYFMAGMEKKYVEEKK